MNIRPMNFHQLFGDLPPICIPLFQRTYCWCDKQILGWWSDAQGMGSRGSMVLGGSHGTGKCVFKRYINKVTQKPFLMCIDGQQRCTTFQLMLSSLRDALLVELRVGHTLDKSHMSEKVIRSSVSTLLKLDKLMFRNVPGANQWSQRFAQLSKTMAKNNNLIIDSNTPNHELVSHFEDVWTDYLQMGTIPQGAEPCLIPSFVDRTPFFACLFGGLCAQEAWRCTNESSSLTSATSGSSRSDKDVLIRNKVAQAVKTAYMNKWSASRQVVAKKHFDLGIQALLHSKGLFSSCTNTTRKVNSFGMRCSTSGGGSSSSSEEEYESFDHGYPGQHKQHLQGGGGVLGTPTKIIETSSEVTLALQQHELRLRILVSESKRLVKRFTLIMSEVISDINLTQGKINKI